MRVGRFLHVVFVLALPACGTTASATHTEERTAEQPAEPRGAESVGTFLGFRFGDSADWVAADVPLTERHPDPRQPGVEVAVAERVVEGVSLRAHLTFSRDGLAMVSATAYPVTIEAYEAVARHVERELGLEMARMECGDDGDEPLTTYLASGHGSVRVSAETDALNAAIELHPVERHGLSLHAYAVFRAYLPPVDLDGLVEGTVTRPGSGKTLSACGEVNDLPQTTFLGVPFGASSTDARTALGAADVSSFRHAIAGVDGTLMLYFYDDCLAAIAFRAETDIAGYRALGDAIARELGTPRHERCSPDGSPPTEEDVESGRGLYSTYFETAPMRGLLRLARPTDDRANVALELSFEPLRPRAPRIDFSE